MRRLIINADDFGYTPGVNRAIAEAHCRGIVTSSTLMAKGQAFDDAVRRTQQLPQLSIGCHVVLIDGEPMLDAAVLPSLTRPSHSNRSRSNQSRSNQFEPPGFRDGLKTFAARALTGRMKASEIEAETAAQIGKLQAAGIAVTHVDSHKHTHLFPSVLRPILRAARDCGVRAIRNPFGPRRPFRSGDLLARPGLWTRRVEVRVLASLAGKFRESVEKEKFLTPDGTLGIEVTGTLDEKLFRALAENIPEGTWELVCHPGYNDPDLQSANTRLRESRETELQLLTTPQARQLLQSLGVHLISYRDFLSHPNGG